MSRNILISFITFVVISAIICPMVTAAVERLCDNNTRTEVLSDNCTQSLPFYMRLLCNEEKSNTKPFQLYDTVCPEPEIKDLNKFFIDKKKAKSFLTSNNYYWCGIVCECCHNVCTVEEILNHC
ncbi:hypothetical protein Ahia01_000893600 [Argonauta hians]